MIALKLIAEGLGLGFLQYLICAIGIRNGAVGMVHLYDPKVQERAVALGLMTAEEIRKRSFLFRSLCLPSRRYQLWESAFTDFVRTQTLCRGGELCDFRFVRHETDAGDGWERSKSI